jgi:hypothetical protein
MTPTRRPIYPGSTPATHAPSSSIATSGRCGT